MTDQQPDGATLIAAERQRQQDGEGRTAEHDDAHDSGDLLRAATCYLTPPDRRLMMLLDSTRPVGWPWEPGAWKPSPDDRVRELVKAGALIAAEIDRIQRASRT